MSTLHGIEVSNSRFGITPVEAPPIAATIAERAATYGDFGSQARITQELKCTMSLTPNWDTSLDPPQREALEMIASKIARILNGDPNYADSWHDIAGYATLIEKRLQR